MKNTIRFSAFLLAAVLTPILSGLMSPSESSAQSGWLGENPLLEGDTLSTRVFADVNTFTVTITNDSGSGSFRQAIMDANVHTGYDTIAFSIGSGVQTIMPLSALPTITDPVCIDGTTQPGFTGSPVIELNGNNAGGGHGLEVTAGNSTIRGLVINRFGNSGIVLQANGGNHVEGNYIGTSVSGTIGMGNGNNGVAILNAVGNIIGGVATASRNVISDNDGNGVIISGGGATGNRVVGNYIGTDATGTAQLGNLSDGVFINGASNNIIGGVEAGAGNVISGNGVTSVNANSDGIDIGGGFANIVQGNFIGTSHTGTSVIPNSGTGVHIVNSPNNIIGGITHGSGNMISGNRQHGIRIWQGGATGNIVQGNFIGTDTTGTLALGNLVNGVLLSAPNNAIGGTTSGTRNIISGNEGFGIQIDEFFAVGNVIRGNLVGTQIDGASPLGNGSYGVYVSTMASNNFIGDTISNAGNTIAFNNGGVFLQSGTGNRIRANRIFSNVGLGIDLGIDGVTQNDSADSDIGPNNLQNYPVITSATSDSSSITIQGTLHSTRNAPFKLEFFQNLVCDPPGFGEGQTFIGVTTVVTSSLFNVNFAVTFPQSVPPGRFITATATDSAGNTSEFSQCTSILVSVEKEEHGYPASFRLDQNYPNPFNPVTSISFSLPSKSFVTLKVLDALGREVTVLLSEDLSPGTYSQQWNAAGLASGVYFYRLQAGNFVETKKLILLR